MKSTELLKQLGLGSLLTLWSDTGSQELEDLFRQAQLLTRSGLFQRDWYLAAYPQAPAQGTLGYFLRMGWRLGHSPGPDFDLPYYSRSNPDVVSAGINPALHFEMYGRDEGRLPTPPQRWTGAGLDAASARRELDEAGRGSSWPRLERGARVTVLVHSAGNLFMSELADLLKAGLAAAGFDASSADERAVWGWSQETLGLRIIVAPHEFFHLPHEGRRAPAAWAEGAVLLNVEQLQTAWFAREVPYLRKAAAVWDLSLQSAARLARAGFPSAFLPLGYVPDFAPYALQSQIPKVPALDGLEAPLRDFCPAPEAPLAQRPIDIFFIGSLSPRREAVLGRMAPRLARWRCHWVLPRSSQPLVRGRNAVLEREACLGLAQRSKIVLNLHQSDELFFEWHRIVHQGIWQRALVLTESVQEPLHFQAGQHFLEAPLEELPDLLDWVLGTPVGMETAERVRKQGYRRLVEDVNLARSLGDLLGAEIL